MIFKKEHKTQQKYYVQIGNGQVTAEAPTRDDCLVLLVSALQVQYKSPIQEAIR